MNATGTSLYERTVRSGRVEHVQFLYAGGSAIALRVTEGEGPVTTAPPSTKYYHRDHLGSVTAMSDEFGRVVDSTLGSRSPDVLGYDAWGARRAPEGAPIDESTVDEPVGRRGYTGHETISDVGLVNMNGRVYDPALGRFLSADPHVQFITNLQSYNRYSYVLNNPLRYTDPTGYASFLQEVSYVIGAASPVLLPVMGLVACVAAPGAGCLAAGLMITAANAAMQAASGAALDQVLIGAGISTAAGLISGGIAGQAVSSLANGPGKALLAGAISGGLSGAITTVAASALGGDLSMKQLAINVLVGAATGALSAAATYATSSEAKVTQASVDGQGMGEADEAWGGWGSREKYSKAIFAGEEMDFLASASPGSEPVAGFKGKVVQLLENGGTRTVRALKDFKDAVSVRRSGGNVLVDTRQHAKQVEGAAHGTQDMLRHNGHSLPNNQRGMPHYQTQGVKGHSFWSKVNGGVILFFDSVLDLLNPFDAIETKAGCAALRGC